MKNITLEILQNVTKGKLYNARSVMNVEVTAIIHDSRNVRNNCVFLCIPGNKVDGASFAGQVLEEGALAVICERELPDIDGPYLLVDSVLNAAMKIAEYYRKSLGIKVVGITGSVGKTSTKEFIASVLSERYRVHKTKGNYNSDWGVAFTIFDMDEDDDIAVIEMGINHEGEMDRLAKMARPDIAVITNIGESHLEFFKSREGILKAKSEIFNYMDSNGSVILNGDDDKLSTIISAKNIRPDFYGLSAGCSITAEKIIDKGLLGSEFDMIVRDGGGKMSMHISLPVPGKVNIYNALAASMVGLKLSISPLSIRNALKRMKGAEGRFNVIETERFLVIDDCYNASPKSVEASLDILKTVDRRKVAILGDMLELGEDSEKFHFRVGKYAGTSGIDVIIFVGALSEKSYMGAKLSSDCQADYYRCNADCIRRLPGILQKGDAVLIKASNSMNFKEIVDAVINITDEDKN